MKWEYRTDRCSDESMFSVLQDAGDQHWELVSATWMPSPIRPSESEWCLIFKRPQ